MSAEPTRRSRFKQYMANFAAAADPALAIHKDLYVHPPSAVSDLLVHSFEVEESRAHLIVGGIGAGKSTQLLMAATRLNAHEDIRAIYVDVSTRQDIVNLKPGCLVALAGISLLEAEPMVGTKSERKFVTQWAQGYLSDPREYDWDGDDEHGKYVPGVIVPPRLEWPDIASYQVERVKSLVDELRASGRSLVLLFDSLDRTSNLEAFVRLVEQDVAALRWCGAGLALIGPLRSLEGFGHLDVARFDKLYMQPSLDVAENQESHHFLSEVIRRRSDQSMITPLAISDLVNASGGILRDLISLAKGAGDEAYLRGDDIVDARHVLAAVDAFGRALMIGLRPDDIETLKHLQSGGGFVRTSDEDLALIATRRIVHYPTRAQGFAVHPAIAPLLDQKAG